MNENDHVIQIKLHAQGQKQGVGQVLFVSTVLQAADKCLFLMENYRETVIIGSRSTATYSLCGGDEPITQNRHVCDEPITRERLELLATSGEAICVRCMSNRKLWFWKWGLRGWTTTDNKWGVNEKWRDLYLVLSLLSHSFIHHEMW